MKDSKKREEAAEVNDAVALKTLPDRSHCPTGEKDWVYIPPLEPPGPPVPRSEDRPILKIYMDQAVIGDLHRVQLHTGQFSTCRAVLLYNQETGVAGLFHYPGGGLTSSQASTVAILQKLSERVNPTDVYIFQGLEPFDYDQDNLLKFFQDKNPHVSEDKFGSVCFTLGPDGQLAFNKHKSAFSGLRTPEYDFNQMAANLGAALNSFKIRVHPHPSAASNVLITTFAQLNLPPNHQLSRSRHETPYARCAP
jgi:hypothetical protein